MPLVAAKDITCYKVLVRKRNGHLYTPYLGARASVGKAIEAKSPNDQIVCIGESFYQVESEGVHAYTAKEDAIRLPFHTSSWIWTVAEAIIPAGTEYWCSFDGMEIAARKMIINRIIYQKTPGTIYQKAPVRRIPCVFV